VWKLGTYAIAAVLWGVGGVAAAQDRDAAWRQDIEVTRADFLSRDRSYSPQTRAAADARLAALARDVERLSDQQIVAGLAQAAALSQNAHTRAYILRNRGVWRRYPIRIWNFEGEWRVIAARPEHAALVGARLERVSGTPVARAQARLRPLFAGNDAWARYMAGYTLTSPDALIGMGLLGAESDGAAVFEFRQGNRRTRVTMRPEPFVRRERPEENWWFLTPAHPATQGWTHVLADRPLPAVLDGASDFYRYQVCDGNIGYLQFNRASDAPGGETVRAFGARVLDELAQAPPERLVIDLRFNTGGNLDLGRPFFEQLAATALAQEEGRLLVLVGPNTFSAAITHLAQLRMLARPRVVGAGPGDELDMWSEGGNVILPNSQIAMHYADRAHTYSMGRSTLPANLVYLDLDVETLTPDAPADWTWRAYSRGEDPYARAALGVPLACPAAR